MRAKGCWCLIALVLPVKAADAERDAISALERCVTPEHCLCSTSGLAFSAGRFLPIRAQERCEVRAGRRHLLKVQNILNESPPCQL